MDNDQVFAVDADINAIARRTQDRPPAYTSRTRSHDVITKVNSGQGSRKGSDFEETPLLSREYDSDDSIAPSLSQVGDGEDPPLPHQRKWAGADDFAGKSWWNKPSIFWLLPPFLVFMLAFGGVLVPKLNLILSLICQDYLSERALEDPSFQFLPVIVGSDNPQCRIPEVQALVSRFTLYLTVIAGFFSALTSPKLGALSDRYGRKGIMCLTISGTLFNEIFTIIAATYPETVSVYWLLLGAVLDGICGSFTAAMALVNAYTADCTPPQKRNVTFGYFHGTLFTGIAFGPLIAGYIIKASGQILTVFYIAVGCHLTFLGFILFIVPESLSKERQLSAQEKKKGLGTAEGYAWLAQPDPIVHFLRATWHVIRSGGGLFTPLSILWPKGEGSNPAVRRNLVFLAAVDTTMFGVAMGSMTIVVIYSEYMFGWGNFESSIFVSIVNICRVTVLVLILPLVTRLVRGRKDATPQRNSGSDMLDLTLIRVAIAFDMLGYIGYATVRTGNLLILSGAIASVGGMGSPTLQAALTKHVPQDRTGQLLGAVGLLHAMARVVAPTVFNLIYSATVGKFTQTVFVCLAATFGVAFVLSWFIRPYIYLDEKDEDGANGHANGNGHGHANEHGNGTEGNLDTFHDQGHEEVLANDRERETIR